MLSITSTTTISQKLPKGLRVLRQKRGFLYTVDQLDQCCAAHHPQGCGLKRYCRQEYDTRCGEWTYVPSMPTPTNHGRRDPEWMPVLELRKTLRSIQRLPKEEG